MIKSLSPLQTIQYRPEWCQDLTTRWSRGVPISEKMGMHISHYDGQTFHLKANLAANFNVHGSMFAGSVYSQCVLAGWGLIWLQLKEEGLVGEPVLTESTIKYHGPVDEEPEARVAREGMPAVLQPLKRGSLPPSASRSSCSAAASWRRSSAVTTWCSRPAVRASNRVVSPSNNKASS